MHRNFSEQLQYHRDGYILLQMSAQNGKYANGKGGENSAKEFLTFEWMASNEPENACSALLDRLWTGMSGTDSSRRPSSPEIHWICGKPSNHKELENNLQYPNKQARSIYIQTPRIPFRFSESYSSSPARILLYASRLFFAMKRITAGEHRRNRQSSISSPLETRRSCISGQSYLWSDSKMLVMRQRDKI